MHSELKKDMYSIQGMHCKSCEILIEDHVSKVSHVDRVHANHAKGLVEVYYGSTKPSLEEIEGAIKNAGYSIGQDQKKQFFSTNPSDYVEVLFVGSILFGLILWLKAFGLLNWNYNLNSSPSLFVAGVVGLTAGVSTCMALIGGIVLAISARHSELHPEASAFQKFRPHLFFNAGRVLSYVALGGVIGLIGSSLRISNSFVGFLTFVVGIAMLFLGLKLLGIFPGLSSFTLPKAVSRIFGRKREEKEYSHKQAFISGALTFFLPCGFTQAMQLYAMSTGSFLEGSLVMGVFALGTAPGLLGIGSITSFIKGWVARYFFKFAGLAVIGLGVLNISNGYNLTGIVLARNGNNQVQLDSRIENGVQVVEMVQENGYNPNRITIKKGIPVKWVVNSKNSYHCSSYLVVPSLDISQALQQGENIITFTPTKTGAVKFTCGMGMYSGFFNVVN